MFTKVRLVLLASFLIILAACEKKAAYPTGDAPFFTITDIYGQVYNCEYYPTYYGGSFHLKGLYNYGNVGDGIHLSFDIYANINDTGSYSLTAKSSGNYASYNFVRETGACTSAATTDSVYTGSLKITTYNNTAKQIAGKFLINFSTYYNCGLIPKSGSFQIYWQ